MKDQQRAKQRTPEASLRVFLSSSWEDLREEREGLRESLSRMGVSFVGMEVFGSSPATPIDECLAAVDRASVFVLVVAHRYGAVPPELDISFVQAEYQRATERGLPCFVYFKDDQTPVLPSYVERDATKAEQLCRFKAALQEAHIVSRFTGPEDLAQQVATDLHKFIIENVLCKGERTGEEISLSDVIPRSMLELVLEGLSQRFRMPIGIFTPTKQGHFYSYPRHLNFARYCRLIRERPEGMRLCQEADLKFAKKCMRSRKPVIYQCHAGFTDFAVPIHIGATTAGAIFGGQIVVKDQKEASLTEVKKLAERLGPQAGELVEAYVESEERDSEELYRAIGAVQEVAAYFSKLASEKSVYAVESAFGGVPPPGDRVAYGWEGEDPRDVLAILARLPEEEFTLRMLVPLLERAGYRNVRYCHGPAEAGCDLRYESRDPMGCPIQYGAQVKMGRIRSKASGPDNVATLISQAKAALTCGFCDEFTGECTYVDQFWIMSPQDVSEQAQRLIASHNQQNGRREIRFLTGQLLLEKLKQYVPGLLDAVLSETGDTP